MLILVRHGRTAANAGGLLQGRRDLPLDELGEQQAAAVAASLAARPDIERIVTSPLLRARQTAEAISAATGAPITVDEAWIELDYGAWDGTPLTAVPPAAWAEWRRDPAFAPPGGESLREVAARVEGAASSLLDGLAASAASTSTVGAVVVVSHVSPIKAAVCWALGGDEALTWRLFLAPASVSRIGRGPAGPVLHGFNEVGHLPSA